MPLEAGLKCMALLLVDYPSHTAFVGVGIFEFESGIADVYERGAEESICRLR